VRKEEEEEEFFNHYKNDLERHAHTPSGVAGADLSARGGGGGRRRRRRRSSRHRIKPQVDGTTPRPPGGERFNQRS